MKDDISYDKKKRQNLSNKNFPIQLLKMKKISISSQNKETEKEKKKEEGNISVEKYCVNIRTIMLRFVVNATRACDLSIFCLELPDVAEFCDSTIVFAFLKGVAEFNNKEEEITEESP